MYAVVWPESDLLLFNIFASCFRVADGVFRYERLGSMVLAGEGAVIRWVRVVGGEFGFEIEPK